MSDRPSSVSPSSVSPSADAPPPPLPLAVRAAVGLLLVGSAVAAGGLARAQLHLAHGPGAAEGAGGLAVSGVPAVVWATPWQVVALVLLVGTGVGGARGEAARGAVVTVLGLLTAMVGGLGLVGGWSGTGLAAWGWGLAAMHAAAWGLSLLPAGPRRPRWPQVDDWLPAMLVGLTALMGFGFWARIVAFQLDQEVEQAQAEPALSLPAEAAVATALRTQYPVSVPPLRSPAPIDDQDPSVGPLDAPVTVVSFLDLQDEASRRIAWMLVELEPRYQDRVRFVTKHLPMDASCNEKRRRTTHPRACAVAVALQCAHAQRGFRGYRLNLLRNPHAVEDADLDAYAASLGLDPVAFAACRAGEEGREAVTADVEQAGKGTMVDPPLVFVEGRVLDATATLAQLEATLAVATGERPLDADGRAAPLLPVVTQAAEPRGPAAMVPVGGAWMDAVESALDPAGGAVAEVGALPWPIDLDGARAACAAAGKRLCTRAEWVAACQGAPARDDDGDGDLFEDRREGRLRPYGDAWRAGWCPDAAPVGPTGVAPACRTPEGLLDLAGGRAEWVEEGVLLGGAAGDGERAGCHAVEVPPGPGWRGANTGFRCCADASVPAAAQASALAPGELPAAALPPQVRAAVGEGAVVLVPWRLDCAPCQQALIGAVAAAGDGPARVLAVNLQEDLAGAREWLARGQAPITSVDDPQGRLSGALGVPELPWVGAFDAQGRRVGAWRAAPGTEDLERAFATP
ncbi:hypothetical protein L6R53_25435 [Myxococcota bacterium]|nr:hypothetical protein [Myxococcota bacterium]